MRPTEPKRWGLRCPLALRSNSARRCVPIGCRWVWLKAVTQAFLLQERRVPMLQPAVELPR
jgi:hypothetical protein